MSSYQERQLLCGLTSSRRDSGALSKVLTNYPVRTASEGHAVQGHRPSTVDNLGCFCCCCRVFSFSDVSDSFMETLDQRKHRTVQLCTEAPKNHTLEHSPVQRAQLFDSTTQLYLGGHVNPSFIQTHQANHFLVLR